MEKVEWISNESLALMGYGLKKKGDRFDVPTDLKNQLVRQGLVKDAYKERKTKKGKGDK